MSNTLFTILVIEGTSAGFSLLFRLMAMTVARSADARDEGIRFAPRFFICGNVGASVTAAATHHWAELAVYVIAGGLVALWMWWRRKKRRGVAALLGAKSRALRDAIVRRAREAAQPRQVLRPVPQGAR